MQPLACQTAWVLDSRSASSCRRSLSQPLLFKMPLKASVAAAAQDMKPGNDAIGFSATSFLHTPKESEKATCAKKLQYTTSDIGRGGAILFHPICTAWASS